MEVGEKIICKARLYWDCPVCTAINTAEMLGGVYCRVCGAEYEIYKNDNHKVTVDERRKE